MPIVQIPLSSYGLTGFRDSNTRKTGDLLVCENVDFSAGSIVQKEGGSSKINSSAITDEPTIMSGFDYFPSASVQRRVIATSDGKIYKDDMTGAFGTTLKSGLTVDRLVDITEAGAESQGRNRKLFIANGVNAPQVLSGDGATTANLTSPPADWTGNNQPQFFFQFRNSLVGAGNVSDAHRIYGSLTTDHEDFLSSGVWQVSVYPGESQRLVAATSGIGRAFLWKFPRGIYYINDTDGTRANWFTLPLTHEFGAAATPHAVTQIDNGQIAFLTPVGDIILMEESGGSVTGIQFTDLTKSLGLRQFIRDNFNLGRMHLSQLRWYDEKHQLHLLYAQSGSLALNRRMVIDLSQESARVSVSNKDMASSIWIEQDTDSVGRPVYGDNAGFLYKLDQPVRSINDGAYTFKLTTHPMDFSDVSPNLMAKKLFYRLHVEARSAGDFDILAEIIVDGVSLGTVTFSQSDAGLILDATFPDPDTGLRLGGDEYRRRSADIGGEGYTLQLNFYETTVNNPQLERAWVEFDLLEPAR